MGAHWDHEPESFASVVTPTFLSAGWEAFHPPVFARGKNASVLAGWKAGVTRFMRKSPGRDAVRRDWELERVALLRGAKRTDKEKKMLFTPIQVECYAGYKADESPRRFFWQERWIEVVEILDRWYQGDGNPEWPLADYFKVATENGSRFLLKHDRESDDWYVARQWKEPSSPKNQVP